MLTWHAGDAEHVSVTDHEALQDVPGLVGVDDDHLGGGLGAGADPDQGGQLVVVLQLLLLLLQHAGGTVRAAASTADAAGPSVPPAPGPAAPGCSESPPSSAGLQNRTGRCRTRWLPPAGRRPGSFLQTGSRRRRTTAEETRRLNPDFQGRKWIKICSKNEVLMVSPHRDDPNQEVKKAEPLERPRCADPYSRFSQIFSRTNEDSFNLEQ